LSIQKCDELYRLNVGKMRSSSARRPVVGEVFKRHEIASHSSSSQLHMFAWFQFMGEEAR